MFIKAVKLIIYKPLNYCVIYKVRQDRFSSYNFVDRKFKILNIKHELNNMTIPVFSNYQYRNRLAAKHP